MTPQEAIEKIKEHTEIHFKKEKGMCPLITEALNMAVNTLEKQIAKKPIKNELSCSGIVCPYCQGYISYSNDFCGNCGQSLDWSGRNE